MAGHPIRLMYKMGSAGGGSRNHFGRTCFKASNERTSKAQERDHGEHGRHTGPAPGRHPVRSQAAQLWTPAAHPSLADPHRITSIIPPPRFAVSAFFRGYNQERSTTMTRKIAHKLVQYFHQVGAVSVPAGR